MPLAEVSGSIDASNQHLEPKRKFLTTSRVPPQRAARTSTTAPRLTERRYIHLSLLAH